MDQTALQDRYDKLLIECHSSFSAFKKSRKDLWHALARAYLWWHDCQQVPGYLDTLYAAKKIGFKASTSNAPNFNPLLRLLFDKPVLTASDRTLISTWSGAVAVLHADHTDRHEHYRSNAEGKLVALIEERGGLVKMARKAEAAREEIEEEDTTSTNAGTALSKPPATRTKQQIAKRAQEIIAKQKGTGSVSSTAPLRVGEQDLIAVLARRMPDGKIVTLGSTYNSQAIQLISEDIAASSVAHLSPNLRVIVEVLRSQLYPWQSQPRDAAKRLAWRRSVLMDKSALRPSDLLAWQGDKNRHLYSAPKLLIRGADKTLLLSGSKLTSSVVTQCTTHVPLVSAAALVFLRIQDRARLEHWLETSEVHVRTASPSKRLATAIGEKYTHKLSLKDAQGGADLNLHFYDATQKATYTTSFQASFDFEAFKADWSCVLPPLWFGNLRAAMLDKWFVSLGSGTQVKRDNNRSMWLRASKTVISVRYNAADANSIAPSCDMPAGSKWRGGSGIFETRHLSKDLAAVLYNLADAAVVGDVEISGNASALVIRYSTDVGQFCIAVPAVEPHKKSLVRHEQGFKALRYG